MLMRRAEPALRLGGGGAAPSGRGAVRHWRRGATAPHRQRVPPPPCLRRGSVPRFRLRAATLGSAKERPHLPATQGAAPSPRSVCGSAASGDRADPWSPRWDGADGCGHPDGPAAAISGANAANTSQLRPLLPINTLLYSAALEIAFGKLLWKGACKCAFVLSFFLFKYETEMINNGISYDS